MNKLTIVKELIDFLLHNKKYWLLPMVLVFVVFGFLVITAQASPVAPFIYTIF